MNLDAASARGELDAVVDEIPQHLLQPPGVPDYRSDGRVHRGDQLNALGVCRGLQTLHGRLQQRSEIDGTDVELHAARQKPIHVEQVVDQLRLKVGIAPDDGQRRVDFANRLPALEYREPPQNRV